MWRRTKVRFQRLNTIFEEPLNIRIIFKCMVCSHQNAVESYPFCMKWNNFQQALFGQLDADLIEALLKSYLGEFSQGGQICILIESRMHVLLHLCAQDSIMNLLLVHEVLHLFKRYSVWNVSEAVTLGSGLHCVSAVLFLWLTKGLFAPSEVIEDLFQLSLKSMLLIHIRVHSLIRILHTILVFDQINLNSH